MTKVELCSDAYLDKARAILSRLAHDYAEKLGDEKFSTCQIYTDAPEHLRLDGQNYVYWYVMVRANEAVVTREIRDDVDMKLVADYSEGLPRARTVYNDDPEQVRRRAEQAAASEARGERTGSYEHLSPAMMAMLRDFHNELALITA
jgi:hypothetical protein